MFVLTYDIIKYAVCSVVIIIFCDFIYTVNVISLYQYRNAQYNL